MDRETLIKNVAKMIEGLAVPYSLNRAMVGTAGEAWLNIRHAINLMGYPSSEEIEIKLNEILSK